MATSKTQPGQLLTAVGGSGQLPTDSSFGQLTDLANLAPTLFGSKVTRTNTANTLPLEQLIAQNQNFDYNALLQQIMQALTGQIPQVQSAYGRAVGARTNRNSPAQVGLNQLITQAGIQGANTIGQLQQQQQQAAMQGAAALANSTRRETTATPGVVPQITALLGLLQAGNKLGMFPSEPPSAPAPALASNFDSFNSWQQDLGNMNMNSAVGFNPNAWEQFLS